MYSLPVRDIQVLCPMNRGSIGVRELNKALRNALNPARPGEPVAERFGGRFQVRDKAIPGTADHSLSSVLHAHVLQGSV
jgi:exodeoxyribonuclease V alpha subunit